jgi:hypothetical protein
MSARIDVAQRIADFIDEHGLARVFGGEVAQSGDKKYYSIGFSLPATLDGTVRVYSPKFILVEFAGRHGNGRSVFDSPENVLAYLMARFVSFDLVAADAVPLKFEKSTAGRLLWCHMCGGWRWFKWPKTTGKRDMRKPRRHPHD